MRVRAEYYPPHPVRREEAVLDALAQRVRVERTAEVPVRVDIRVGLRCRGESELDRGVEIVQDLPPHRFLASAATMALVDDDQVEVISPVLAVRRIRGAVMQCLIRGEVDAP